MSKLPYLFHLKILAIKEVFGVEEGSVQKALTLMTSYCTVHPVKWGLQFQASRFSWKVDSGFTKQVRCIKIDDDSWRLCLVGLL